MRCAVILAVMAHISEQWGALRPGAANKHQVGNHVGIGTQYVGMWIMAGGGDDDVVCVIWLQNQQLRYTKYVTKCITGTTLRTRFLV